MLLLVGIVTYSLSNPPSTKGRTYEITPESACSTFVPSDETAMWMPGACDVGNRFKVCVTVTDALGQNARSCQYLTVRGACTFFTADVNGNWRVEIVDAAMIAVDWQLTGSRVTDLNADGIVDILDIGCVAFHFDERQSPF